LYYAFSVRSTMCLMLLVPGLYAVLNIINVYINPLGTTVHLIVDSQALLRLLYMFSLIEFTISVANAGNTQPGTIAAAVHQVGNFFERLQVKPLSLGGPPCCKIFWCRCSYAPGKAFLSQCVARVYVAVILQSILIVVRQGLIDTSMEAQLSLLLTLWGLGVTFLALSAKMPLDALLNQILLPLPRQQMVAKWRNRQYMIWFVLMGGLHNIVAAILNIAVPGCQWWFIHQHTIVAVELVFIVWIGHCAWVPPFTLLGCPSMTADPSINFSAFHITTGSIDKAKQQLQRTKLVLSEADAKSVLSEEKTLEQVRDESAAAVELANIKDGPGVDLGWGILYDPK